MENNIKYYCVGFHWYGENPTSQLNRFLKQGIWENGYDDKFLETVNKVPVGAKLAAKTTYTRKVNGKTISVLEVHAIGTVTKNHKDGQTLEVNWEKNFTPFTIDGRGAYRSTIAQVNYSENIDLIFRHQAGKIKSTDEQALSFKEEDLTNDFPLNQILYGPPGTGKTFHTINKSVSIADGIREEKLSLYYDSRGALKDRFDELIIDDWDNPNGQIAFVTFHQSMSYEDFVEGIKPMVNDKDEVFYDVEPGIFKRVANIAQNNWLDAQKGSKQNLSFEEAFNKLKEEWEENQDMRFSMKREGKEFTIFNFSKASIRFKKATGSTSHTLSINTLRDYFYNKKDVRKYGVGIYYPGILDKLRSFQPAETVEKEVRSYVLIIDEINRGNISQIFGELITLIEDDKRLGAKEEISVTLPYSKERLVIPPNLFIVGTMNTADRSVETLDTALRRRFVFEEKEPQPELLQPAQMLWRFWWDYESKNWNDKDYISVEKPFYELIGFPSELDNEKDKENYWGPMKAEGISQAQVSSLAGLNYKGINLYKLLHAINKRIEKLLGKDYKIGHAYFINVLSIDQLKKAFQFKILPLLQEYFFGDYGRVGLVIGEVFIVSQSPGMEIDLLSVSDYDAGDLNEAKIFNIQNIFSWDDSFFVKNIKAIYGE